MMQKPEYEQRLNELFTTFTYNQSKGIRIMQPQYAAPNKIRARIEIYDRYGANPIKLEIYVEQTGFDYIKETFEYHIIAQQEIPGFRYHKDRFVTHANIYSVLAAVVKKIESLE